MTRALVTLVAVLGVCGVAHGQGVSPGRLARDHAALEGVERCVRCHAGGDAINASSCLSCHRALGRRIAIGAGYHANLGSACARCHPDHRGVSSALVVWPGGRDAFEHDKAGYRLTGGHAKIACRGCHKVALLLGAVADALTGDERRRTYLGLDPTCVACHADVHKPTLGTDCQRCHEPQGWDDAASSTGFDHGRTRFPLDGGHTRAACTRCHGGTPQKLDELHPAFASCQSCHRDPHAGAMGDAKACAACHREPAWKELHYDRKAHAPRTLPLVAGHATLACAACHGAKLDRKPAPTCSSCHADPHRPSLGTRCEACHQAASWTGARRSRTSSTNGRRTRCAACTWPSRAAGATIPGRRARSGFARSRTAGASTATAIRTPARRIARARGGHAVDGWNPARFEALDRSGRLLRTWTQGVCSAPTV